MAKAPRGERLILTLTGRRNAGKSSLINALVGQEIAIVSDTPGTTTDPVPKSYELLPLGPVTFYDTAGIDDVGELGAKRIQRTRRTLFRTDIALMVVSDEGLQDADRALIEEIKQLEIPFILVFNKTDIAEPREADIAYASRHNLHTCQVSAKHAQGITELKEMLVALAPDFLKQEKVLAGDLIYPGDVVLLIAPIDLAAPKGRLILPQVQVLREILDNDALGMIVKEREIEAAFERLGRHPDLVITDSQVVLKVAGDVPPEVKMTTFSILFARYKGELDILLSGIEQIDKLQDGDKVLIAEACSHHVQKDDIGRVKLPRWIREYTKKELIFETYAGHDFPENLEDYSLCVHCGGCMINAAEMNHRILECHRRKVPITNYGLTICKVHGAFDRAIAPLMRVRK